jgi:hypothetical protein
MTALVSGQHLLAVMPAHPHARRSRRRTAWSRAGVSRAAYRARIRHQQLSRRRSGVVIASRGGRAGTMVGKRGASARRASPSALGRSRQRAADDAGLAGGIGLREAPAALLGCGPRSVRSGGAHDGPRPAARWPGVHSGWGATPGAAAYHVRPTARTPPALGARAWSSRSAAGAPERWWGNAGASRAARIPIRTPAVAATDHGRLAPKCADPRTRRSRWTTPCCDRPLVHHRRGTAAGADGVSRARPMGHARPAPVARGWSCASRGGRAGTTVGKCGRLPRLAHPIRPRAVAATDHGREAAEPAAGIAPREAPALRLGCWPPRSEAAGAHDGPRRAAAGRRRIVDIPQGHRARTPASAAAYYARPTGPYTSRANRSGVAIASSSVRAGNDGE